MKHGNRFKDLVGKTFGYLTVLNFEHIDKYGKAIWKCRCKCGTILNVEGNSLTSGHTKSCGCYAVESARKRMRTHGMTKTALYEVWSGMKARCNNKNNPAYKRYGNRGISVCNEWNDSFLLFYKWAINNGYKKGLMLDRTNNNGNYKPANCRFVNRSTQNLNKCTSKIWHIRGETFKTAKQAAYFFGVVRSTVFGWCYGYVPRNIKPRFDCYTKNLYN